MGKKYILPFKKISKKDISIAGGKGASLGALTQAVIPVPPGFVIAASCFHDFLHITDLEAEIEAQLKKLNYQDINSLEKASSVIRDVIHDQTFPEMLGETIIKEFRKLDAPFVAVRSSATAEDSEVASWAGELDTFLNTARKDLLKNIKKCWSSLFTTRALMYRHIKKLHRTKISVAVIVQKMIQSEISGVAFTVHPVTKDWDQMVIEAALGLGEAIVSGKITPDTYVVQKSTLEITDKNRGAQDKYLVKKQNGGNVWKKTSRHQATQQKLPDSGIIRLSSLCLSVEKYYGKPQDIEWAFQKGKFYILQSRPITTL